MRPYPILYTLTGLINTVCTTVQGFRYNITANHSRSLATSTRIPDLTDGVHTVRVKYDPKFDEKEVPHPSFQVSGFTTWFMNVSQRCLYMPMCSAALYDSSTVYITTTLLLLFSRQNADFSSGGEGDWGVGFGLLSVFVDDMYSPIITTPINLGATLQLDDGRSYVGLTAATGDEYWQAHDILR